MSIQYILYPYTNYISGYLREIKYFAELRLVSTDFQGFGHCNFYGEVAAVSDLSENRRRLLLKHELTKKFLVASSPFLFQISCRQRSLLRKI